MERRHNVVIAALLFVPAAGLAAGLPAEGKYDFTACWSGATNPIAFSKTHNAFTYEMTGASRASQPGALFDKTSFHCIGLNMNLEGKVSSWTVCESIDAQGDKMLTRFEASGGHMTRTQVSGTGKYEGAAIAGAVETLGPFPLVKPGTFQSCNHQTGTYRLPKLMK